MFGGEGKRLVEIWENNEVSSAREERFKESRGEGREGKEEGSVRLES
jgi:hypothetical protein